MICVMGLYGTQPVISATTDVMVTVNDSLQVPLSQIIAAGLPVLYVETVEQEEPSFEIVTAPTGLIGATINAVKVPGRLTMFQRINGMDSVVYDSGEYEQKESGMTIKVRGNSSAREDEVPYKIKLQKKFDLLMRGVDSVYKDKDWLLLRDDYLLTTTAFVISRIVGTYWVPGHRFVNLVINDRYHGHYLLCESIKRNPKCRLNVDKQCGLVFECDAYWWNEDVYVYSTQDKYNYTFKYPEDDEITQEQQDYTQQLVYDFEASLKGNNYPDLIDVNSFATWCMVHDIMATKDGGGVNRFYIKYDTTAESKIIMPVAWDFDLAERGQGNWSRAHRVFMTDLFNNSNKAFVSEFVRVWCAMRETFADDLSREMDAEFNPDRQAMINSYALNDAVWGGNRNYPFHVAYREAWTIERAEWLDSRILAMRVPNDVNLDGKVDVADVSSLISGVLGKGRLYTVCADINGDGQIDVADVSQLINVILGVI